AQAAANFGDGLALPKFLPIFRGAEGAAPHAVDIQIAMQMIDFMLKNSRVPAGSLDGFRIAALIQTLHSYAAGTRDEGKISRQAETALEEFHDLVLLQGADAW